MRICSKFSLKCEASHKNIVKVLMLANRESWHLQESFIFDLPYLLDQKPRLLIFSSCSRRRPLFENGYNSRAATILGTFYQHLYLYLVLHIPQPSI